jgi:hypothetical protein
MLSLELGAPRLAYGFALAAGTSLDLLRRDFFNSSWRGGDISKANVATTEEGRRLFLSSISPLAVA